MSWPLTNESRNDLLEQRYTALVMPMTCYVGVVANGIIDLSTDLFN